MSETVRIFGCPVAVGVTTTIVPGMEVTVGVNLMRTSHPAFATVHLRLGASDGWCSFQTWAKTMESAARSVEKKVRAFRDMIDAGIGGAA